MADAMEGDYEAIQTNMLDPLAIRFRDAVKANRKGKLNLSDESILEGKTYFPEEGKSIGLIDKIGDSMAAVLAVSAMAHARKIL
jgi:ClpP class serine protease